MHDPLPPRCERMASVRLHARLWSARPANRKHEELHPRSVDDLVYPTDRAWTREQVIEKEVELLDSLSSSYAVATCPQFLRRFAKAARADHKTHEMAHYLAELSLLGIEFLNYTPSVIAASALLIAICTTNLFGPNHLNWDATLQSCSTYTFEDLKFCANKILATAKASYHQTLSAGGVFLPAVREKYTQQKFDRVSQIQPCVALSP